MATWSGLQWSNPSVMTNLSTGGSAVKSKAQNVSSVSTNTTDYSKLLSQLLTTMQQPKQHHKQK